MSELTFVVPILSNKLDDHAQFCREVATKRASDQQASRKRLGITKERGYLQQTPQGPVFVVYVEGPRADHFLQNMGQSTEAYDKWFLQNIQTCHGIDFAKGKPPIIQHAYTVTTTAPINTKSMAFCAPLPKEEVEDWQKFNRDVKGRSPEHIASLERAGVRKQVVCLCDTPQGPVVCVYMEGIDQLSNLKMWTSDDKFDRWFVSTVNALHGIEFAKKAKEMHVDLRFDWYEGKTATQTAGRPAM